MEKSSKSGAEKASASKKSLSKTMNLIAPLSKLVETVNKVLNNNGTIISVNPWPGWHPAFKKEIGEDYKHNSSWRIKLEASEEDMAKIVDGTILI